MCSSVMVLLNEIGLIPNYDHDCLFNHSLIGGCYENVQEVVGVTEFLPKLEARREPAS